MTPSHCVTIANMSTVASSEGTFPVVVFFPGFACTTPASAYSTVLSHIASWGYVVIGMTTQVTCLSRTLSSIVTLLRPLGAGVQPHRHLPC